MENVHENLFPQETDALREALVGKTITSLNVYSINDDYFQLKEDNELVVDGGVEIQLGESFFSVAWKEDRELFEHAQDRIETLTGALDAWKIDLEGFDEAHQYLGKTITDLDIKWNWYHDLDENFEPAEEKTAIPKELILGLDGGGTIQLTPIMFYLQQGELTNPMYNSQASILINFNSLIEVTEYSEL